ncbi:hypothetical protein SAMN05660489_05247 [Pseudomonas sp. LAMO17WK12:I10]|uniref:hypothetical protein n=1 Tax=unclassified Pseudomonas TaxID=196821 RepID=UPI000BD16B99|nr:MULTISPECIES: hypothetical protein [unclassified Pseudomonas]PXX57753.1 hypothetical protein H160_05251 [Pseudomonas sp. LAMO17WK12:I9]SNY49691.1 hypothetical protein SAMN05660489_05247 [Pseudomonas sp. LAMO17WK12:I10]
MLYGEVDRTLLKFLHHPLQNIAYLDSRTPPSLRERLMARIPLLRNRMSREQIIRLLAHKLRQEIYSLKGSIEQRLFEDPLPPSPDNYERFLSALARYFNVSLPMPDGEVSDQELNCCSAYIQSTLWAKLEYTCNRATENLQLPDSYTFSILKHPQLWLAYYLSETFFLLEQGLMDAHFQGNSLVIRFSELLEQNIKSYWLSEISEYHSNTADMQLLQPMKQLLIQHGSLPPSVSSALIDYLLDKCLSIHPQFIQEELKTSPLYEYLREVVYIAGHLEIRAMCGQRHTHYSEFAHQVSPATLSLMESALSSTHPPLLNSPQSYIQVKDGFYIRGALKLKYGLKKIVGHLLLGQKNPGSKKDIGHTLGNNFERDYIIHYIQALESTRFKVYDEFKAKNNAHIQGYDVDLVLHDQHHDRYYFIQVKYRLSDQPTYLSEQYHLMSREEFHRGYAQQLLILKQHLNHESIRKKLTQNGLAGAQDHNSHFILLHNLSFLSFHQTQGVYFYEWNLFRNLLKNGRLSTIGPNGISEEQLLSDEQLWQPERIVEAYFQDSLSGRHNQYNYDLYRASQARYRFANLNIVSDVF